MSVPISGISCLSPYLGAPGQPRPSVRRLGRSGGSTVRSSRFRVCPHVLATMRPFGHHHCTLRVERFTLNVPDRHIGHRVCPHICVPHPALTDHRALGQVRRSRVRSPAHGETPCLSPFSGGSGPQSVSVGWQALGLVRVKKNRAPKYRVCPSICLFAPPTAKQRVCPHIWSRADYPI